MGGEKFARVIVDGAPGDKRDIYIYRPQERWAKGTETHRGARPCTIRGTRGPNVLKRRTMEELELQP